MTVDDYEGVYELWSSVAGIGLNSSDDSFEGFKRYIERNPDTSFVAEDGGRVVGAILAGHDGRRALLHHTAVLPQYRRQGIGKLLVSLALDALKKEGIRKAGLLVFRDNDDGNAFWEKLGFREKDYCVCRDKVICE